MRVIFGLYDRYQKHMIHTEMSADNWEIMVKIPDPWESIYIT